MDFAMLRSFFAPDRGADAAPTGSAPLDVAADVAPARPLAAGEIHLADVPRLAAARVVRVVPSASAGADTCRHLADIGFAPGERVMVLRRGWPGADPLAVRVGASTFALRRAEAECVVVQALREAAAVASR